MIKVFTRKASGAKVAINPAYVEHAHDPGGGTIIVMANGNKFQIEGSLEETVAKLNER